MAGYICNAPVPQATQTRQTFTASSGQTSFATVGYVAGGQFIQVYLNGVLLKLTDDYTAENGSDISLTSGAATGDVLEFISFADFTVNNQNFTGGLTVDNDGSTVLTVDRATSDGTIIDLQKSGSSVGSIGAFAGDFIVGSTSGSDAAFRMDGTNNVIYASNTSGNARDNAIDLGASTVRWKDLYLSGGVYLGGVGSANHLSDYETGNWTPTLSTSGLVFSGTMWGKYVKIGRIVHLTFNLNCTSISGTTSTDFKVSGIPFNFSGSAPWAAGSYTGDRLNFSRTVHKAPSRLTNDSFGFLSSNNNSPWSWESHQIITSGCDIRASITYETSS